MVEGATVIAAHAALHELALFAAVGFLVGGLDELVVDLIWLVRTSWRRVAIYSRHPRASADLLARADQPGRIAVFVPAWDESAVIAAMIDTALTQFGPGDYRLYVGCYPNDPETIALVHGAAARDPRVRPVVCSHAGPTNKADCLNHLWTALLRDEELERVPAKAILLHDAEDVVHRAEIAVLDRLIERFDFVQFPVLPLAQRGGIEARLVSGHYCDEFAEAHGKLIVVREAVGAAIPSAGVGCGIARDTLARIADAADGLPFDPGSVTEDYELGLRIGAAGGRGAFVRLPSRREGGRVHGLVAVREHFPASFAAAVRQKSRWIAGIALCGWDRLGWSAGFAENWMRLRDRRALLAALILVAAYGALLLWATLTVLAWIGIGPLPDPGLPGWLAWTTVTLAFWRVVMRTGFVAQAYGARWALGVLPRMIVGNFIAMMAARRALCSYARELRGEAMRWEKTAHVFPEALPAE
ncbi:MAG: glycosyl transferase family protein [Sphingomonadaceae bacterium]|nr:glycosyl transferase family protein [Sphingomonadaceae bacterium]